MALDHNATRKCEAVPGRERSVLGGLRAGKPIFITGGRAKSMSEKSERDERAASESPLSHSDEGGGWGGGCLKSHFCIYCSHCMISRPVW